MKKLLVILMVVAMASFLFVGCLGVTPDVDEDVDVVVTTAAIPGVTAPVTGATPVTTITATAQYTGVVTWSPVATTFAASTAYTATITLTAATGYTLTGVAANLFTVAGATTDTNPIDSGVVTAVFPATAAAAVTGEIVSIPGILGVAAPVYGVVPDVTVTASTQYTGVTTWATAAGVAAGATFAADTVYVATITLTAATGFTLTGVTANFFLVAGADGVSNPADSGVAVATFPKTEVGGEIVSISAIPGVAGPVTGAVPDATVTATTQYTGTVAWKTAAGVAVGTTFASGTVYVATITLIPIAGFTFTGVTANFFADGTGPSVGMSNPANSGVVTATYLITDAAPIVVSAEFTDSDTITIVFSENVLATTACFTSGKITYPYTDTFTGVVSVIGSTTKILNVEINTLLGVQAVGISTGTIVITAALTSAAGVPIVAKTQIVAAGGF